MSGLTVRRYRGWRIALSKSKAGFMQMTIASHDRSLGLIVTNFLDLERAMKHARDIIDTHMEQQ